MHLDIWCNHNGFCNSLLRKFHTRETHLYLNCGFPINIYILFKYINGLLDISKIILIIIKKTNSLDEGEKSVTRHRSVVDDL